MPDPGQDDSLDDYLETEESNSPVHQPDIDTPSISREATPGSLLLEEFEELLNEAPQDHAFLIESEEAPGLLVLCVHDLALCLIVCVAHL